jgi:hypothetical protein
MLVDVLETLNHFKSLSSVSSLSIIVCIFRIVFKGVLISWEVDAIMIFESFSIDFAYSACIMEVMFLIIIILLGCRSNYTALVLISKVNYSFSCLTSSHSSCILILV